METNPSRGSNETGMAYPMKLIIGKGINFMPYKHLRLGE